MRYEVVIDADQQTFWRWLSNDDAHANSFRSRMALGVRPRLYRLKEDAVTYAGVSCWDSEAKAILEAQVVNEGLRADNRPARWTHVVSFVVDGHNFQAWADDLGAEHHYTAWGEPDKLSSTAGQPVPISDREE